LRAYPLPPLPLRSLLACMIWFSFAASGYGADVETGERFSYPSGAHRIHALLSLNDLQVVATPGSIVDLRALPHGTTLTGTRRGSLMRLAAPATDRDDLERLAAGISATMGVSEVMAVIHDPEAPNAGAMFLSRRVNVALKPGQDARALASDFNLELIGRLPVDGAYAFVARAPSLLAAVDAADRLVASGRVAFAAPAVSRHRSLRSTPNDPLFAAQWHLKNDGTQTTIAVAGNDIQVEPAWNTSQGLGVNIAMVDTGIATAHPDLAANVRTDLDIDLVDGDADASAGPTEDHGTVVAGLAAARGDNAIGVTGVAYRAGLIPVRLVVGTVDDQQEAAAILHHASDATPSTQVWVSSNSWGPPDDGFSLGAMGPLMAAALRQGGTSGRGGRGVVYVWACGNGVTFDNAGYDAYTNSRFAIAVAASDSRGGHESYSESGPCLLLNAPGGDFINQEGIVSTDRVGTAGFNPAATSAGDYTTAGTGGGGTSYSAPIVAGTCALILSARPQLTRRDLQHLLAATATKNDATDAGWFTNGVAKAYNHRYGFGRIDAGAAVAAAPGWALLPAEATPLTASTSLVQAIPDASTVAQTLAVAAPANFRVEHVEFTVDVTHPRRGQLSYSLTSPSGTVSSVPPRANDANANLRWTFMSVATLGELAVGTWTLTVRDNVAGQVGMLNAWSLKIYGYLPYAAPTIAAISPDGIEPDGGATTLTVTGSGFAINSTGEVVMTTALWNGAPVPVSVIDGSHLQVTIPNQPSGGATSGGLALSNPATNGLGGGNSGSSSIPVDHAPTLSLIADQTLFTLGTTGPIAFLIGDAETAASALTVTAASSDPAIVAAPILAGSNANRTIAVTASGIGTAMVTVVVFDGARATRRSFQVTVKPDGGSSQCGFGGGVAMLALLAIARTRRRR
jgi:MYXO-CTERM domain-containing protein